MRYLPPLLVALVLAVIGVRCALEPSRAEARLRIAGMAQGGDLARARTQLERYQERYDEAADRWFAASMWFRLRDPVRGVDTIWNDEGIASRPETARRFAETALLSLGWETDDRTDATSMEPAILVALVEGGNTWARERLQQHGREYELLGVTAYFFPAYRRASKAPLEAFVEVLREREDEKYHVAAALGSLSAEDYPEKAADIKLLRKVLASDSWRRQYRDVWLVAALALGRSGNAGALAALREAEATLAASSEKRAQADVHFVRIGLLAAGRFEVDKVLAPVVFSEPLDVHRTIWYLEALIHRYRSGDMRSELRLRQIWEGPGARFPVLRSRIARAFLLQDKPPSADAVEVFVGRMVRELEAPDAPLIGRVLAAAWRLRAGEAGAQEGMLQILRAIAVAFSAGGDDVADLTEPFVEALRALYLYG